MLLRRAAVGYLVVQGVGVLAWWVLLLIVPASRPLFTADGHLIYTFRPGLWLSASAGYGIGGEFRYASDLVAFVRAETGDRFHIEVAAYPETHPQAKSPEADLEAFAAKVKAGADSGITQYFFNSDAYFRYQDDLQRVGVDVPVVPGIMPITSSTQLMRFSDACGAEIPRWIRMRLQAFGDDTASIKSFGLDVVTDLCDRLRTGGVPGLHFYTMNQSAATMDIAQRLGLS